MSAPSPLPSPNYVVVTRGYGAFRNSVARHTARTINIVHDDTARTFAITLQLLTMTRLDRSR